MNDYHLHPQFLQCIVLPILLLARPNKPVVTKRFMPDILSMLVLPQVGHLGMFSPLFLKAVSGSAPCQ
jgi:hypothetical protein